MALADTFRFIWLDAYIGQDNEYHSFKSKFCTTLEPGARSGDPLDILICALKESAAPFIFVDTPQRAIQEIELYRDKHVIFITSGSLGQQIIPRIATTYDNVHSFYIFCAVIKNYVEFAMHYLDCLQIFNSELDLLVRLVRDISMEIINKGKQHLEINDPIPALDYFERSKALEMTANETDKLNHAFYDNLRLLNGYDDDIGLIQKALNMKDEQEQEPMNDTAPEPFVAESQAEEYDESEYQDPDPISAQPETEHEDQDSPISQQISQEDGQ